MDDGGFDVPHENKNNDDDDEGAGDATTPFQPGASSMPGPSGKRHPTATMTRPAQRGSHTAETSFIEGDPDGRDFTADSLIIPVGNETLAQKYPEYGKEYGFTVVAVLLAAGTTIGVVLSSLSKGLKSVVNGVCNGLKELGKKKRLYSAWGDCQLCVSHSRSFLGKNAWLLILVIAAFLIECVTKRR